MGWGSGNLGGGSGGLNFKVVAYATEGELLSATPNENTIGVITTTPITALIFSPVKPQSLLDGGVWISTGTSSAVAFNAIKAKKKAILLYPIAAMQYVDGTLSAVVAKSYKGGAWVDWWNGELYDAGNQYESVTGGWVGTQTVSGSTTPGGKLTVNDDNLSFTNASNGSFGVATQNAIDLTGYTTLHVIHTGKARLMVADAYPTGSPVAEYASNRSYTDKTEITLDVSAVTGAHKIAISNRAASAVKVYKVWMT